MLTIGEIERRFADHVPMPQDMGGRYAVLVPLVARDGELHLLFEVRADTLKRQPNEVCFPGGQIEPGETYRECALRETREELGIPPSDIRIISDLDYVVHHFSLTLYPVLAQVEEAALGRMKPSPEEVRDTFLVPLSFFRDNPPLLYAYDLVPSPVDDFPYQRVGYQKPYTLRGGRVVVPIYEAYQGYVVWGMTARIVHWLIRELEQQPLPEEGEARR